MEYRNYLAHFPQQISPEIKDYTTDHVFKHSRYIFTRREGKQQYGYCTHCKSTFKTDRLRHNMKDECPNCKSICCVKASGLGRKKMIDEGYFVYYEKSVINPQAIVARGIYVVRDYSDNYHKVETQYLEKSFYIFEVGTSIMLKRYVYYSRAKTMESGSIERCKSVYSLFSQHQSNNYNRRDIITDCSRESIREAVKNTPFQYSTWDFYIDNDMVKFFSLYSKYPCVEYLTKFGMDELVMAKLTGENTYSAINWRGKTPLKILKLSKNDIKGIKNSGISIDPLCLKLMQLSKRDGSNLTITEVERFKMMVSWHLNDLLQVLNYTTMRKALVYMEKQCEKDKKQYYAPLTTWKDYIADCILLQMNLADERILYPKNLLAAHQETTKRIKTNENKLMDAAIQRRIPSLSHYCFEYQGLFIRPANSTGELIAEGKALVICVGNYNNGYITKYSKGQTNILLIRKISEPDKPFYTMELRKNAIIQVQGLRHCSPDKAVAEFIKVFTAEKLSTAKRKLAASA